VKLHRLVLTNYRGIAHREVQFPDTGVVVISGANEIGKTSMIEALDLLLESKDRSTKKEVKQVKPTHADVGSEVLAEISAGQYRFVYRKRFHKKCETELSVLSPRREQLTGDEAHERVLAILRETVDTDLWHAQRVLQTGSMAAVDLSGCDALSRALDVAAGGAAELSGSEPLLLERIDAEYAKYFTGTGRPTGDWAAAIALLKNAEIGVARCEAAVAEVDARVRRHGELVERLDELVEPRRAAKLRVTQAEEATAALADLREQIAKAELVARAAKATCAASTAAHGERCRLRTELSTRIAALAEIQAQLANALQSEATAREAAATAATDAVQAVADFDLAEAETNRIRAVVEMLLAREDADRLDVRLKRIYATDSQLAEVAQRLSVITLTDEVMGDIERATMLVQQLEAQLALAATTIEFTAAADIELNVGEQVIRLAAGETWWPSGSEAATVDLPGVLAVRITPGINAADIQGKLVATQTLLVEVLAQGGATDVQNAREIHGERKTLTHERERLAGLLRELIDGDDVAALAAQLVSLRAAQPGEPQIADLQTARRELADAAAALAQAQRDASAAQRLSADASKLSVETSAQATVIRQRLGAAEAEIAATRQRLEELRLSAGDDEIAARAALDADAHRVAEDAAQALSRQLAAADPDAVEREISLAVQSAERLDRDQVETERALKDIAVELAIMGTEGRQGNLDAAQIALEHATAEHDRVSRRARASRLLKSVMTRHRDDTRQSYVAPFRAQIEMLGRPVFGPSFEIEIDSDLRICSRTLNGRTVPYDSLSGGAKEQLGILARLAGAALVAKEDSVPVVIDDALGFTDPERLVRMGSVFDTLADHGQVIVLTCTPTRYLGIPDAHLIELASQGDPRSQDVFAKPIAV
jgi:uncharacterized protein YhaN